jgi:hypothetical protein
MQVMVIVHASAASEADAMPAAFTADMMAAMGRFNDELRSAGVLLMAHGLAPTAKAKRIRFEAGGQTETAGPFTPAAAQVAGFWLWDVPDMDSAMAWARRCPPPMPGPCRIEVRPFRA